MNPRSEYIAPFNEDCQIGLVQTAPPGGVVGGAVVTAGDDALTDGIAEGDVEVELDGEEDVEVELDGEEDVEVELDGEEDVEVELDGEEDVEVELDGEEDVEVESDGEEDVEVESDGEEDVEVEPVLEIGVDGDFVAEADSLFVPAVGAGLTGTLSTVKATRRLEVLPLRQVNTTLSV